MSAPTTAVPVVIAGTAAPVWAQTSSVQLGGAGLGFGGAGLGLAGLRAVAGRPTLGRASRRS